MWSIDKVDTDIWMACNAFKATAKTGYFNGLNTLIAKGPRIKPVDRKLTLLTRTVVSAVVGDIHELLNAVWKDAFGPNPKRQPSVLFATGAGIEYLPGVTDSTKKSLAKDCFARASGSDAEPALAYKARPLNGIWATAPYLHNGSVPTLYDLLLPATVRQRAPKLAAGVVAAAPAPSGPVRPDTFYLGSREFDPHKVGFVYDKPVGGQPPFSVYDSNAVPIPGNYNSGHTYGTTLSDPDRWALVEYLKGL